MTTPNSTHPRTSAFILWVLLALAISATIPSRAYARDSIVLGLPNGPTTSAPIDWRDTRLQAAMSNLAQLAGHPITIRVDPALLPTLQSPLQNEIALAIEALTEELAELHQYYPKIFAEGIPRLQRIEYILDAKGVYPSGTLDLREPVLRVVLPPRSKTLRQYRLAWLTFTEAQSLRQEALYAQRSPDSIAPAEHLAYFKFLDSYPRQREDSGGDTVESLNSNYRLGRIIKMARLYQLSRDAALRTQIRAWLVDAGSKLVDLLKNHPTAAEASPPSSPFRQAEQAWVAWFKADVANLDERQYDSVVRLMFRESRGTGNSETYVAMEGLDPLQFGIDLMSDSSLTGTRGPNTVLSPRARIADSLLCPRQRREERKYCGEELYHYALSVSDGRSRLARALLAIQQDLVTETVLFNISEVGQDDDVIELTRALENNQRQWSVAIRTLRDARHRRPEVILDEFVRLWRVFPTPARRGPLLYAMSGLNHALSVGNAEFDKLFERFKPVSANEYAAFLDQGFLAMSSQSRIWKLLSPGWSQTAVIVPRLDAWFDSGNPSLSEQHDRGEILREVLKHLCSSATTADRTLLRGYLRGRLERHSGEVVFQDLLDTVNSPHCGRRGDHQAKPGKTSGKTQGGSLFED